MLDDETCFRAASAKDRRFDGRFVVGVTSTHIYCRPSCPARTPRRAHMVFFPSSAAAHASGFRACKRCRPGAVPGSPEWNARADVVARAVRLIADGFLDRESVGALAARLGYSTRQLHRHVIAELGAGPLALARARRAESARLLLETTTLPVATVCFAAGFESVRQFNDTIQQVFARTPSALRAEGRRIAHGAGAASITLRLAYRPPIDRAWLFGFLAHRAVPGVEEATTCSYRRVLALPHDLAVISVTPGPASSPFLLASLELGDLRDLTAGVERVRRLFDLDADPETIDDTLGRDDALRGPIARRPGMRVPGAVDGGEIAIRAVLGQQVSVAGARTLAGRLAAMFGRPLPGPNGSLVRAFPDARALAGAAAAVLPLPAARARALVALCTAVSRGDVVLDPGADRDDTERALRALPGVGPWTAAYVRMRALSDPDAIPTTDLGLRRAWDRLRMPDALDVHVAAWRPWRAYAAQHLWACLDDRRSTSCA